MQASPAMPPSPSGGQLTVRSVNNKVDLVEGALNNESEKITSLEGAMGNKVTREDVEGVLISERKKMVTLEGTLGAKATREDVEFLVNKGIEAIRAELAAKQRRTDIQYIMREFIDDLAAPRSWVDESHSRHNEMREEIVRVEQDLTRAITELRGTVVQYHTNIDEKMTRDLAVAQTNYEKMKTEVDVVAVKLAVMEMHKKDAEEQKMHEKQKTEAEAKAKGTAPTQEKIEAAEAERAAQTAAGARAAPNPERSPGKGARGEELREDPPGLGGMEDPLLNTAWRRPQEFDISSPVRGKGGDGLGGKDGGGKGGKDGGDRGNLYEQKEFDKRCH